MIFVDSNVPMYLVGAEHPNKARSGALLERAVRNRDLLVSDAEVFQEILHRYTAIRRTEAIPSAWKALAGLVDEVFSVELADVEAARDLLVDEVPVLSARDALHVSIMRRHGVREILSFDGGFDQVEGLLRLH